MLEPPHAEVGLVHHHEFDPVAGRQVGDALDAELLLECSKEFSLAVFGNVQLADAFDGRIAVVQADDMKVLVLQSHTKVVQPIQC